MSFLANKFQLTGNINTLVAGSRVSGTGVPMARVKAESLSAHVNVDCETSTLTMTGVWQGATKSDFSDAVDLANGSQNVAGTVFATGTAGADANVVKNFPAPAAAYGFKFCRFQILTGVVTGNTVDTYDISYNYRSC